jgi:hypothetical protein
MQKKSVFNPYQNSKPSFYVEINNKVEYEDKNAILSLFEFKKKFITCIFACSRDPKLHCSLGAMNERE